MQSRSGSEATSTALAQTENPHRRRGSNFTFLIKAVAVATRNTAPAQVCFLDNLEPG
jgi:hypothetical protein